MGSSLLSLVKNVQQAAHMKAVWGIKEAKLLLSTWPEGPACFHIVWGIKAKPHLYLVLRHCQSG